MEMEGARGVETSICCRDGDIEMERARGVEVWRKRGGKRERGGRDRNRESARGEEVETSIRCRD
jgi:hypothetical protein